MTVLKGRRYRYSFLAASLLGTVYLMVEIILKYLGSEGLCRTEGCRIVAQQARFGDLSILLIGVFTFALLSVLAFLALRRDRPTVDKVVNLILIVSLAAEGFFTGYQAFRIQTACLFCLITLGFFLVLAGMRLLSGERDILAGLLSFAGVFVLFWLILPSGGAVPLPQDEMVLFYSQDCKYCQEVIKEIECAKLKIRHLPVSDYSGTLKAVGIEHVPTLLVNRGAQKLLLTGKEAIDNYLFCKPGETKPQPGAGSSAKEQGKDILKKEPEAPADNLLKSGKTSGLLDQPQDEGVCQEDVKCK
ncbi:MAG: hypothetical protein M0Z60_05800 [Nitrospiraceae bacterium]|nr:hypothetical protein [Nitrospiraceae bacterium]